MTKNAQRGAAEIERLPSHHGVSWDDLRLFLACADGESFRKAASDLRLSSSTLVRRIKRLEDTLGAQVFERLPEGIVLTREGRQLLVHARQMERACFDFFRQYPAGAVERGLVSISITEGLGTYWVMPRLVEFQRQHPFININLQCAMQNADVLRLEADMAVQFSKPQNSDLRVVKLGRLHVQLFAARRYLDLYGMPESPADLAEHRLVNQLAPGLDHSALARHLGLASVDDLVSISANTSTAHFYAVERGAGIGALPTYALALGAGLIAIDICQPYHMDIWLTYHPDARKTARRAQVIDWLRQIFDPKLYPWFRDEFIHPVELAKTMPPEAELNIARGYYAATPR